MSRNGDGDAENDQSKVQLDVLRSLNCRNIDLEERLQNLERAKQDVERALVQKSELYEQAMTLMKTVTQQSNRFVASTMHLCASIAIQRFLAGARSAPRRLSCTFEY